MTVRDDYPFKAELEYLNILGYCGVAFVGFLGTVPFMIICFLGISDTIPSFDFVGILGTLPIISFEGILSTITSYLYLYNSLLVSVLISLISYRPKVIWQFCCCVFE